MNTPATDLKDPSAPATQPKKSNKGSLLILMGLLIVSVVAVFVVPPLLTEIIKNGIDAERNKLTVGNPNGKPMPDNIRPTGGPPGGGGGPPSGGGGAPQAGGGPPSGGAPSGRPSAGGGPAPSSPSESKPASSDANKADASKDAGTGADEKKDTVGASDNKPGSNS